MLSGPLRSLLVTINYRRRMKLPWLPTEKLAGQSKERTPAGGGEGGVEGGGELDTH
jgi:hypothetical protein